MWVIPWKELNIRTNVLPSFSDLFFLIERAKCWIHNFYFLKIYLYWSIIASQYSLVSVAQQRDSAICIHMSPYPFPLDPPIHPPYPTPLGHHKAQTLQARRKWQDILKVMKEKNLQPRLLYPARISFRLKREIKAFTHKQMLREFSTTKPAYNKC